MAGSEIRRAADRARTSTDWLDSRHSFAFGPHYEPDNVGFGPLVALNSDLVRPGPGYLRHRHAGLEILSWVAEGELEHEAWGQRSRVRAGQLQYLSAGAGIEHAERSASPVSPVRVVQMWLTGPSDGEPAYQVDTIPDGHWVLAASARRPAPIRLRAPVGELWRSVLPAGTDLRLPAERLHLFVVAGTVLLDGQVMSAEDALRGRADRVEAIGPAELLVWAF